jgi:acetyl-CoA carboxylase carboxyltransferase component
VELEKLKATGQAMPEDLEEAIARTKADYEQWLDSRYSAARGHCDAIIDPNETRDILTAALELCTTHPGVPAA